MEVYIGTRDLFHPDALALERPGLHSMRRSPDAYLGMVAARR
jgi:hypothetical protein